MVEKKKLQLLQMTIPLMLELLDPILLIRLRPKDFSQMHRKTIPQTSGKVQEQSVLGPHQLMLWTTLLLGHYFDPQSLGFGDGVKDGDVVGVGEVPPRPTKDAN